MSKVWGCPIMVCFSFAIANILRTPDTVKKKEARTNLLLQWNKLRIVFYFTTMYLLGSKIFFYEIYLGCGRLWKESYVASAAGY